MKTLQLKSVIFLSIYALIIAICGTNIESNAATSMVKPQGTIIPFDSDRWNFVGSAKTEDYLGEKTVHLGIKEQGKFISFGMVVLKDMDFHNGIIEFDIVFDEKQKYPGINFRQQGQGDFERFYMRPHESGKPDANSYIPVFNGVQSWQLYDGDHYSSNKKYSFNTWQHVKLVVNGNITDIYIGNMEKPELTVELKHKNKSGTISLYGLNVAGDVRFANFAVKKMDNPEIKGAPKPDVPAKPGTILSWPISDAFDEQSLLGKTSLTENETKNLNYTILESDITGMTNLAKVQGIKKGKDTVFAKIVIISETDQIKKLEFGFSDKVKVYLNNHILFEGSDVFLSRDHLFLGSVGFHDTVYLPLKKGDNEVLLAITDNNILSSGWGVQARFKNMEGITLKTK